MTCDRHIGKTLSVTYICGPLNFATSINQLHDNAMTNVHGYVILSSSNVFHYSVGFDIAYLQLVGNAKALRTG